MKSGDVVVGISHSGRTKDLIDNLKVAAAAGATTICITGGIKSPIAANLRYRFARSIKGAVLQAGAHVLAHSAALDHRRARGRRSANAPRRT